MRRLACLTGSLVLLGSLSGCFGRTGLSAEDLEEEDITEETGGDADAIVIVDSAPEAGEDTSVTDTRRDGWIDIFDVIPIPAEGGGPLGDCARCTRDNCGDAVNACINDPTCRSGLTCVLTTCLTGGGTGGGFDFACITKCFKGDFKSAGMAISAFTCVTGKCGTACGGIFGLLGGGGDAGPPPPKDGGTPKPDAPPPPADAADGGGGGGGSPGGAKAEFSPYAAWTPERIQSMDPATRISFSIEAFSPWAREINQTACEQKFLVCE